MFDVKKHLIKVQGGRQYLPVAARLLWFRTEHPDWGIETKAISIDVEKQFAIFESTVYNAEGRLMAKGTKMENVRGFGDWLEKAETGAIGRALAVCGYGTQFAPDLDESPDGGNNPVDTPYPVTSYREERGRYDQRQPAPQYSSNHYDKNAAESTTKPAASKTEGLALVEADNSHSNNGKLEENAQDSAPKAEVCEGCSTPLKASQLALSLRKYNAALCPDCQKKRKSEEAA
jgi:hypothetical protein